ncbi:unnamed protein product [Prorocentrum cordatum]|uniref:Fringe-like glycosyltransferase domain-containing protein n=1 Tax=Prorocentrum cordatum TaxID=2364126 RepID=A0ABN9R3U1_9DINO|nr:unnamed protein product [Polarella glacialis]
MSRRACSRCLALAACWALAAASRLAQGAARGASRTREGASDLQVGGGGRAARRCGGDFAQCPEGPLPGCPGGAPAWELPGRPAPQVSYALVTGARYTKQKGGRPWAQLRTWLSDTPGGSWAYFSDEADAQLPAWEVPGTSGGWGPSQRKWLGLLARLAEGASPFDRAGFFPRGSPWLFVGDDDTFVWPDALRDRLQGVRGDPDRDALYLGLPDSGIAQSLGIDLGEVSSYCLGGAGFLLSRGAAGALRGQDPSSACADLFDEHAHADVALARCLARTVGVQGCARFGGLNQVESEQASKRGPERLIMGRTSGHERLIMGYHCIRYALTAGAGLTVGFCLGAAAGLARLSDLAGASYAISFGFQGLQESAGSPPGRPALCAGEPTTGVGVAVPVAAATERARPLVLAAASVAQEFGIDGLCKHFGWTARPEGQRRPRLFYCTLVGNNGQQDVYDLTFAEIYPLVDRIVALDPLVTLTGAPRQPSLNMSDARWKRYGDKLRHVVLENPIPEWNPKLFPKWSSEQRDKLSRPGHHQSTDPFILEEWIRAQFQRGLQDSAGTWELHKEDILIVADSDEIPLRESLVALAECESTAFAEVKRKLAGGRKPQDACVKDAKVLLLSQVFEYYIDCPTTVPAWWHPDAILAVCVMDGGIDMQEVRTGSSGSMTPVVASRHIHNFAMSNDEVIFKYTHYAEPRVPGLDAGLSAPTIDEMRWRACDPNAFDIGPGGWYMDVRPSTELVNPANTRRYHLPAEQRRGIDRPLALLEERPELAAKIFWKGHDEHVNPFVGKPGGHHDFSPGWEEKRRKPGW